MPAATRWKYQTTEWRMAEASVWSWFHAAMEEGFTSVTLCRPFDVAVRVACLTARPGQNVLLSPASASYDAFRSFEERGERFASLVRQYSAESGAEKGAASDDGPLG